MSKLFESITIGGLAIKNRIVLPPMCMFVADEGGHATDFHPMHYAARAIGGVGLIIVEATGVENAGRISNNCLGAYEDGHIAGLTRIADAIKAYGAVAAIQLGHAGRKCTSNVPEVFAPSAVAFDDKDKTPKEMTAEDIDRVVAAFGDAAARVAKAGFEMIEIHGAHGYLISTFMSPLANKRTDEYGGSHENRARLLGRVLDAVKANFSGAICVRVSASDFVEGGNTPEDVAAMLNTVKGKGIDILDVSAGGVAPVMPNVYPGYQVKFAEIIKEATGIPVMAGGLLTAPTHMEEIVTNGRADMVFVGRELLRNPNFVIDAAKQLGVNIELPKQYARAY
ncbi:MAG: NADPH dehydrogenase NamA [Defluviitaleaceae bacterium]|nr:NADPH dehydrogenase NamA [Defluviitaleaceae bacterium]